MAISNPLKQASVNCQVEFAILKTENFWVLTFSMSHLTSGMGPVFELRKNKWLSHGQPDYNFWLSVQVFGCPYLEQGFGINIILAIC